MKPLYSFLVLLIFVPVCILAQVGFNKVGYINTEDGTDSHAYYDVIIDKDNKILAVGTTDLGTALIARYNQDGKLDTMFNNTGYTVFPTNQIDTGFYNSVIIDRNNRIIAVGLTDPNDDDDNERNGLIVRYNENGTLDTTFNGTGYINGTNSINSWFYYSVFVDKNSKILVVGKSDFVDMQTDGVIARYLSNGVLDTESNWNAQNFRKSAQINNISIGMLSR